MRHGQGIQRPVQRGGVHQFSGEYDFTERPARRERLLGHGGGLIIADEGVQRGHEHERAVHQFAAADRISLQPGDAALRKHARTIGQNVDRLVQAVRHERQGDIQLEMSITAALDDGLGQALHIKAHLHQHFTHHRVHLAGHDGGTRLGGRKPQFAQAGARPRAQPAEVIGDLGQARRNRRELARDLDAIIARALGLEVVGRLAEREAGLSTENAADPPGKFRMGSQAGTNGGAANGQFAQRRHRALRPRDGFPHLRGVAGKLLSECQRRGVHQVGAADLDDAGKLSGFFSQCCGQQAKGGLQARVQGQGHAHMQRRRDDVIRGLPQVHVVIRMHGPFGPDRLAGKLAAAVRDDLVGVGVRRGAGTGLENIHGEMRGEPALGNFPGGLFDQPAFLAREPAELHVRPGTGHFDQAQPMDERGRQGPATDREIQHGPLGRSPVERVIRHGHLAHRITFASHARTLDSSGRKTKTKRPAGKAGRSCVGPSSAGKLEFHTQMVAADIEPADDIGFGQTALIEVPGGMFAGPKR